MKVKYSIIILVLAIALPACQTVNKGALKIETRQVKLRNMQTRQYDNLSKTEGLRAVIAALQDLEFTIDIADYKVGSITATKLSYGIMTVSINVRNTNRGVTIRANARQGKYSIRKPEAYRHFYSALDKSIFLLKNDVN